MKGKKTLVVGASENTSRYSNLAVHKLKAHQHEVIAFGNRKGEINGTAIVTEFPKEPVHTVTMYVGPQHQEAYYDSIIQLHPERIIFNPGTENETFRQLAEENGIKTIEACTLVMLSTGQY